MKDFKPQISYYEGGRQQMVSGIGIQQEIEEYLMFYDSKVKDRLWFVANGVPNPSDYIYCGFPYDTKSEGFEGRWMEFPVIAIDEPVMIQGPWHSNTSALKNATGIDLTEYHSTWGVIGKSRLEGSFMGIDEVIYHDPLKKVGEKNGEPIYQRIEQVGSFDRIENFAQDIADEINETVYFTSISSGGASSSSKEPQKEGDQE